MAEPQTLHLATPSAAYEITIGQALLLTLHPRLVELAQSKDGEARPFRPFLITSPNIWKLWSAHVRASFPEAQSPKVLFHPPGEKHKRLAAVESLAEQLAEVGADRDALLIAFGGGVIGDITGFLAAVYMRGVPYIQIPTTLLAQVDSSVGGKTGVNLAAGKNLITEINSSPNNPTANPNPSHGLLQQTPSSKKSPGYVHEFLGITLGVR